ncbi:MAG: thiamine biosynthesis lipoprotein [Bermanella sp.]|jgi:thiamine biosynthesis lipoprotein
MKQKDLTQKGVMIRVIWLAAAVRAALLIILSMQLVACSPASIEMQSIKGRTMGTGYSILWPAQTPSINIEAIRQKAEELLININSQMSTYQPDSEISVFNSSAAPHSQVISDDFAQVMALSIKLNLDTDGYFDVSVGPLVNLWGFGPDKNPVSKPSDQVINNTLANIGLNAIALEQGKLSKNGLRYIDLSAIAKGYAVDQLAKLLNSQGVDSYLVEIGGEMRAKGLKPGAEPWKVAIESPNFSQRKVHKILPVTDVAIATSGDYRNFFELDGKHYSHSINPKTGYPVEHSLASVTIIAEQCAHADALATAMLVMGMEKAKEYVLKNDIKAYMIVRNEQNGFQEYLSPAFLGWLTP